MTPSRCKEAVAVGRRRLRVRGFIRGAVVLRARHLADLRAQPADVLGRLAVRVHRRARRRRSRGRARSGGECRAARRAQRDLRDAARPRSMGGRGGAKRWPRTSRSTRAWLYRRRRSGRARSESASGSPASSSILGWNLTTLIGAMHRRRARRRAPVRPRRRRGRGVSLGLLWPRLSIDAAGRRRHRCCGGRAPC